MERLVDVTLEDLHDQLSQTDEGVPTQRVLAAIHHKLGADIDQLAEAHDVTERTIRNWLDRFAEQPIEQAPYDAPRPGGPSKLEAHQREELFETLQNPPTELGYDRQAWSPKLLLHHVKEEYSVEYTPRHARNLLDEAELSWRTARPRNHEADPEDETDFQETVQKNGRN
jgi:transposase